MWTTFVLGRVIIDYCAAIIPRFLESAIQLIVIKFPGTSRQEIVGQKFWSDAQQDWVHEEGWTFDTLNEWYSRAKEIAEAEEKAMQQSKRK